MKSSLNWIKKNKFEFFLLLLIILLAAFLRLYKIEGYMTFLGDEGRDVLVVRKLLVEGDLIFVGPGTSIGNMYLGPFYYYLMAPALLAANFSPVGPAVLVAILGVATVYLVWYLGRIWWGKRAALISSFLYAISPVVIVYSRSSWNPNIMPFFSILTILSLWKLWVEGNWKYLLLASFSFGVMLQSHYLALIILLFVLLVWILALINSYSKSSKDKRAYFYSFLSIIIFFLLMLPLIIFDAKYNWRNFKAISTFFSTGQEGVSLNIPHLLSNIPNVVYLAITRLLGGKDPFWGGVILFAISALIIWFMLIKKEAYKKNKYTGHIFTFVWISISVLGLSLYKQEIYDHYMGFLFPAPFLLVGGLLNEIVLSYKRWGVIPLALLVIIFSYPSITNSPIIDKPNNQLTNTIKVAEKIKTESKGIPFNLAVIADRNYEGAYQYYLEVWNTPLLIIDPANAQQTIAEQLFVVCEYEDPIECHPTSNPKAEVANFGWSKVDESWQLSGVVLFKLSHNFPGE